MADGAATTPDSKRAGWSLGLQLPASQTSADIAAIAEAIEEVELAPEDERPLEPFSPLALGRAARELAEEVANERRMLSPEAEAQLSHPT